MVCLFDGSTCLRRGACLPVAVTGDSFNNRFRATIGFGLRRSEVEKPYARNLP